MTKRKKRRAQGKNSITPIVFTISVITASAFLVPWMLGLIADPSHVLQGAAQSGLNATNPKVFTLPNPSSDPVKNLAVLQEAVDNSAYRVIDGIKTGGTYQNYPIKGNLNVTRDVTIRNLILSQKSTDYGVRTILARPKNGVSPLLNITLSNVTVERGPAGLIGEQGGSSTDSAGIWIDHAIPTLRNIDVHGAGKGIGIMVSNSTGGVLTNLHVHDIIWQPYPVDRNNPSFYNSFSFSGAQAATPSWMINAHEYNSGTKTLNASATRINEQIFGVFLVADKDIKIVNPIIENMRVRFNDGNLYPYQTDGLDIGTGSAGITVTGAKITNVWEGIDEAGTPTSDVSIRQTDISDVHNFCYKIGHSAHNVTLQSTTATRCGIAGYELYGMAADDTGGSSDNIWLINAKATDIGLGPNGTTPWVMSGKYLTTIAAYKLEKAYKANSDGTYGPLGVRIVSSDASTPHSSVMQYGYYAYVNGTPKNVISHVTINGSADLGSKASGFTVVQDDGSKDPNATASWTDISSLVAATIHCSLVPSVHEAWFVKGVDGGWTYGALSNYLKGLKVLSGVCTG